MNTMMKSGESSNTLKVVLQTQMTRRMLSTVGKRKSNASVNMDTLNT